MCDDLTQYLANQTESDAPMVIKYGSSLTTLSLD